MHAESGGDQVERDARAAQFLYMSRMQEHEAGQTLCVLGGDFNAREGEDCGLCTEGWRDAWDGGTAAE